MPTRKLKQPKKTLELRVRAAPRNKSRALLQLGHLTFRAAIGRNGRTALKREGDGKRRSRRWLRSTASIGATECPP